jgi:D-alanyl-lipoteichoic acid acyltransferase DltB (MBOAT superfamily)
VLFHAPVFLLFFLPVTLALYLVLERRSPAGLSIGFLAIASLFFYSWWNPLYLPLLLGSIGFNFLLGIWVAPDSKVKHRRALLIAGVAVNVGVLALFKYADFLVRSGNWLFSTNQPDLGILLPLAISFFTFQQIAFLVDSYEGTSERSFPAYCLFITFFPHLIAGPIVHHREMMPQFARLYAGDRRSNDEIWRDLAVGFTIFAIGLAKKVFFADQFALWSDNAFRAADAGASMSFLESWLGTACFTLQIYLDFSGYSDMAIGLARLFGVKLPLNFDSPYKASSIIEFWRRWHITLSRFLRDYLYFPLGGNRRGPFLRYFNLMLVMLIGGLWHGASWTFVVWGGLHGAYLAINHLWRWWEKHGGPYIGTILGRVLTILAVMVAWVFFRANTFEGAWRMLRGMFALDGIAVPFHWQPILGPLVDKLNAFGLSFHFAPVPAYSGGTQIFWVLAGFAAMWFLPNTQQIMRKWDPAFEKVEAPAGPSRWLSWSPNVVTGAICASIVLAVVFVVLQGHAGEFIYFQF